MATTPKTVRTYPINSVTKDFTIPFEYLARKFVVVTLIGATRRELILNTEYRFTTPTTITTNKAWGPSDNFTLIEIRRLTSATERLVAFADGSVLRSYDLNTSQIQSLHIAEEARDLTADTIAINNDGNLDARARRIVNLGDAVDDGDAVTLRQEKQWAASAYNSATDAHLEAINSQTAAEFSATFKDQATASANTASSMAKQAASSAQSANNSKVAAEDSKDKAKASADSAAQSAASSSGNAASAAQSAASAASAASRINSTILIVDSLSALRALPKTIPNKAVTVLDVSTGLYNNYRLNPSATFTTDNNGTQLLGADGGKWEKIVSSRTLDTFYTEYGAIPEKIPERLFVGGAAKHKGTNQAAQDDWLTTKILSYGRSFSFQHVTQFASLTDGSSGACNAILGAGRTSKLTSTGNTIGVIGVGVNDNKSSGFSTGAWGGYFEGFQELGANGPAYGAELDTINFNGLSPSNPYAQNPKQVIGLQIASGAEFLSTFAATAAGNVQANGAGYLMGLLFGWDSLVGEDGTRTGGSFAPAFALAAGHGIQWYGAGGVKTSSLLSQGTTAAAAVRLRLSDNQIQMRNSNNKITFQVFTDAGHVNFPSLRSSGTHNPIQFLANGDDADIDLQFVPKGSGALRYGNYTAGALTATGYVPIRTEDGVLRKLLIA